MFCTRAREAAKDLASVPPNACSPAPCRAAEDSCAAVCARASRHARVRAAIQALLDVASIHGLAPYTPASVPPRGVFCTRSLDMSAIKCIGYDMDYTLIDYKMEVCARCIGLHALVRLITRAGLLCATAREHRHQS